MARSFNGTTDRLDNAAFLAISEPFTMACWFNVANLTASHTLMSAADKDVANQQHRLIAAGGEAGDFLTASSFDGTLGTAVSTIAYTANTWQHACGVFTSTTSRDVYLDGGNMGSDTTTIAVTGVDRISIGVTADSTPFGFTEGMIAFPAIWDVALTAAEIASLKAGANPLQVRPASLISRWPLTGNDSPEPDHVGRYDLTLTGTTKAANTRIYMPSAQILQFPTTAVGGVTTAAFDINSLASQSFSGESTASSSLNIDSSATVTFDGNSIASVVLDVAANSLAIFVGESVVDGVGAMYSTAAAVVSFEGESIVTNEFNMNASSLAEFVGEDANAVIVYPNEPQREPVEGGGYGWSNQRKKKNRKILEDDEAVLEIIKKALPKLLSAYMKNIH